MIFLTYTRPNSIVRSYVPHEFFYDVFYFAKKLHCKYKIYFSTYITLSDIRGIQKRVNGIKNE